MVANAVQRRKWRTEPDQIVANAVGQKKRIERYAADFPAFDDAYGNNSATPAKVSPAVERAADLKNFPKISTVYDEPSKLRN